MTTADTLSRIAAEIISLAARMETPEPVKAVPVPDLFTQMGIAVEDTLAQVGTLCDVHADPTANVLGTPPARRHYQRNGKRMADAQFTDATEGLRGLPIYINDHSRTMEEIIARMTIETRAGKCRVAFVDYLGLMDISTGWRESLNQAIGKITGELKATAKRLKIPIILLCQLNRDAARADRAPELYDLRDSGSIEQDADIVMMLETDEAIEPTTGLHDINIWLRKNRQYKKDICIKVRPNKTYSHFEEISVETPEVVTEEVAEDDDDTDDDKLF